VLVAGVTLDPALVVMVVDGGDRRGLAWWLAQH